MGVRADVSGLDPLTVVTMFEMDATDLGGSIFRWHSGDRVTGAAIVWDGKTYAHFPIDATGFEISSAGKLPRPTLKAANVGGLLGAELRRVNEGIGAKVTRKRTLAKYLDAVNFPGGNPQADPTAAFPDEVFYVSRKASENAIFIELELAVAFDVEGVTLPRRLVMATICPWVYRGTECGYSGGPVADASNTPTNDPASDQCAKNLQACKLRFGEFASLPYGAFPASLLLRGT